ncbi:hypothetical protein L6Q96_01870 [Candidatus Binatia bacterium]|nr:hypothetical protein [Candidatus Binatia bacterium]
MADRGSLKKVPIYFPPELHELVRKIAFDNRTSINKLVLEWIAAHAVQATKKRATKRGG